MKNGKLNNSSYNLIPSTTLGIDLPNPKPLTSLPPSGMLFYIDFKYTDKLKERRLKLEKIKSKICQCQCSDHHGL